MNPIISLDDLKWCYLRPNQHWYYVLLVNAMDPTTAGEKVLECLDYYDIDSGKSCDFFIPGFVNGEKGVLDEEKYNFIKKSIQGSISVFEKTKNIYIERIGVIPFYPRLFIEFHKAVENELRYKNKWKYSGRCELLMFSFDENGKIDSDNFHDYDLDDIVSNNRTVSEFIRKFIVLAERETSKEETKRAIDELYHDMIMPRPDHYNERYLDYCSRCFECSFEKKKYAFISYSTKDRYFVDEIRRQLRDKNIESWMAPYDIPDGTSYAYIIEKAIENADTFFLMLSNNSINSLWVEKEMLRAIGHYFKNKQDKLHVIWLNKPFDLSGTPFATPLENVQASVELESSRDNIYRLVKLLDPRKATIMYADKKLAEICGQIRNELNDYSHTTRLEQSVDKLKNIYEVGNWQENGRNIAFGLLKKITSINKVVIFAIEQIEALLKEEDTKNNEDCLQELPYYKVFLELLSKKDETKTITKNTETIKAMLLDNLKEEPFKLINETSELAAQEKNLIDKLFSFEKPKNYW